MNRVERVLRRIVQLVDAAAAVFLAVVTTLTFIAVLMRYVFAVPFPGSFDVSRLLLGVAIFWGIAAAAYRNEHIQVDLVWQAMPPLMQKITDLFADIVFALFAGAVAYMLFWQVDRIRMSRQTTFELSIQIWPFHAVAWLGMALCFLVIAARILRTLLSFTSKPAAEQ